ncbi:MAG TPA: M3 family oligoendopeptidase [Anaerolineae bacterium]|nr:M3 family oligoendopeptidase [Anaerolineae bacterium]
MELPHWDMSNIFPSLESSEFEQGLARVENQINTLAQWFDENHIERLENRVPDASTVATLNTALNRLNETLDETQTLQSYIYAFVTTDSRNSLAQAKLSELQQHLVTLSKLGTRFTAWVGSLDVDALIAQSEIARAHEYALHRAEIEAQHQMSPLEEELAAELNLTGAMAWSRLQGNVSSQITVPIELDGEQKSLPMSAIRNLAFDARREVRERAYRAELDAWQANAAPIAAALNSIKGQVNTLSRRRNWESALDAAIFQATIDRATLDAMMTAARESFPDFRRYLRAKARALGLEQLAWYDIFAPIGGSPRVWEFDEARDFIYTNFGTYSDKMRGLAQRAFEQRWIDAEPRSGKRDGAFCMSVRDDESRILSNFKAAYGGMNTLAHELGHAYHNLVIAPRTALQQSTPMTLAETASTFCETIVRQAALRDADAKERIVILEASLQDSCQVVVDISSRFLFESRLFDARRARELSVEELCTLMLDAQKETYGDGLDQEQLHPFMWAAKPHYYSGGLSFYNFPYMFGLLFGLGLYAQYQANPEEFKKGYDDLLSSTGMADAVTLAARFGIDTHSPDFWRASLDTIREDIDKFEDAVKNL